MAWFLNSLNMYFPAENQYNVCVCWREYIFKELGCVIMDLLSVIWRETKGVGFSSKAT